MFGDLALASQHIDRLHVAHIDPGLHAGDWIPRAEADAAHLHGNREHRLVCDRSVLEWLEGEVGSALVDLARRCEQTVASFGSAEIEYAAVEAAHLADAGL